MTGLVKLTTIKSKNTVVIASKAKQSHVFHSGKGDCFIALLLAMTIETDWKSILKIIVLVVISTRATLADEITKTFVQSENGYDGYESVTIANAGHVEKTPLNWWPNNALNRKNDIAADVSEFRCWGNAIRRVARWAIKCDLTGEIPSDATILDATLSIYKYKQSVTMIDTGRTSVHVITTPWTAFNADSTHPWKNYMGDFERTGLDTFYYEDRGLGWQEYTVTSAIRDFVKNPSMNHGVMVRVTDSSVYIVGGGGDTVSQLMTYHSAAASDTAKQYRPKLTVTYSTDPTAIDIHEFVTEKDLGIMVNGRSFAVYGHEEEQITIQITDIRGRNIIDIVRGRTKQWFRIPEETSSGIYFVSLQSQKKNVTRKFKYVH